MSSKIWQEQFLEVLKDFSNITFSTSFSIEDQLITDFIFEEKLPIEIFAIDTGRLPRETYDVWQNTLDKYQRKISAFYPQESEVEKFVKDEGINPFYISKELRLKCCEIRKVEPLQRALKGKDLWISGLRREHSLARATKNFLEQDQALGLSKFYPLLDLSEEEIWAEIHAKNIPFNRLYKQGYRSIGCAPCSRAIKPDEDIRAGRWWWEDNQKKECGLHVN
jgi:phosphoadenosine phosphosulfate reductase